MSTNVAGLLLKSTTARLSSCSRFKRNGLTKWLSRGPCASRSICLIRSHQLYWNLWEYEESRWKNGRCMGMHSTSSCSWTQLWEYGWGHTYHTGLEIGSAVELQSIECLLCRCTERSDTKNHYLSEYDRERECQVHPYHGLTPQLLTQSLH